MTPPLHDREIAALGRARMFVNGAKQPKPNPSALFQKLWPRPVDFQYDMVLLLGIIERRGQSND
jgi:hypothetical protein